MSTIIQYITDFLYLISNVLPLPLFSFFGSLIEEVIAPIPSPFIMGLTGSMAALQNLSLFYIIIIIIIGVIGKVIGSLIVYFIADKGEDILLTKFGKILGVSHKDIESIGERLNKGWQDDLILIVLRAIPIIPSASISVACGLIKFNLKTYIISTFLGTLIKNIFYFYLGYIGVSVL